MLEKFSSFWWNIFCQKLAENSHSHDFWYQNKHGTILLSTLLTRSCFARWADNRFLHPAHILLSGNPETFAINLWFLIFKVMRIMFASILSLLNKIHSSFHEKQWLIFNHRRLWRLGLKCHFILFYLQYNVQLFKT